jgi:HK97 gp10 family phage protein
MAEQELKLQHRDLEARLARFAANVQKRALRRAAKKAGGLIAEEASRRAPKLTGALAEGIRAASGGRDTSGRILENLGPLRIKLELGREGLLLGRVGPAKGQFYGAFFEFGTRYIAARPFLRPALEATAQQAVDVFAEELSEEISKAGK